MSKGYFEVDKKGLAKLLEDKGKQFAVYELLQNAWDSNAKKVEVTLKKIPGRPLARIVVRDDDPDGFVDLSHAFTLFAESHKKSDPTKRGRFNLGEKLVLALCTEASIASTKGTIFFDEDGTRRESRAKDCRTESGSVFTGFIKMNQQEFDEIEVMVHTLIPPEGVVTTFNKLELERPEKVGDFTCSLQTVISDEEGNLKRTKRITRVDVYEPLGDVAYIYELGIPVVESGDRYDLDVQQKVPVNMDRDNVPPSYLKSLRAHCLNETHDSLTKEEAEETWVTQAMEHKDIEPDAVESALEQRFGEKRAVFDPNDLEANNRLTGKGYTVISGGTFSKEAWKNVKGSGAILPSGAIAPTPKPYGKDGKRDIEELDPEKWTKSMRSCTAFAKWLAGQLMDAEIEVCIVYADNFYAAYGRGSPLDLSLKRLGHKFFDKWDDNIKATVDLFIHEFGHHYGGNHLSDEYYDSLTALGGGAVELALGYPEMFERSAYE